MAWDSNFLRNSFYTFWGMGRARVNGAQKQQLEAVRAAMLASLCRVASQDAPALQRRMARAEDVQTLWFLRAELMGVLASGEGESAARTQLDQITQMFHGLLPKSLVPRVHHLGS